MYKNIISEIKSGYDFLTKTEKAIADLLLLSPQNFITYSMAQISECCDVSQGSINNFAKKFTGEGFSSLKLKLAGELAEHNEKEPFAIIDSDLKIKTAMEIKIKETVEAFKNTLQINDEDSLQEAVSRLLDAKKIEVCGMYYSGLTSRNLCQELITLGRPATHSSDMLMTAVSASMLTKNDLLVAISSSGKTKEIIDTATLAQKNDVPILAITSNRFSPLAKIADCVLLTASSGMSVSDRLDETFMSQKLIVDTLCAYMRSKCIGEKDAYYDLLEVLSSHSIKD